MKRAMFMSMLVVSVGTSGCTGPGDLPGAKGDAAIPLLTARALQRPQSWADCERFGGVVTPATFDPASGRFDELYMMPDTPGFLDGVPLISESKPGDQDYNGGRWHLNVLREGVDPALYAEACSVEELNLDDFVATDDYFECPLLPRRGQ